MKKTLIFFFCVLFINVSFNTLHAKITANGNNPSQVSHPESLNDSSFTGYLKSLLKDLKDENGNNIFSDSIDANLLILTGPSPDNFGYCVSSAGDVNGDGFSDVIVGGTVLSKAYIFYGGTDMNNIADVTLSESGDFGRSVSTAGDVNGDGYSDVIVGAPEINSSYIFYGGAKMDNVVDVIMKGVSGSSFGEPVSTAEDVNGDGYSDVIVGAYGFNFSAGRVYIFFGGSNMNNTADVIMNGEAADNYFTWGTNAGDVNGDGFSDVIIGAWGYKARTGRAYIYYGGINMDNEADVIMTGKSINDGFGETLGKAGDVNGDGYSDVIVGAYGQNSVTGRAYIYFGGSPMNNVADVIMTGEANNNYFGTSVSTVGDLNKDGFSDVIIGAEGYNNFTGRAYIFYGGLNMNNIADTILTGEFRGNHFGNSVSNAGDINGDGKSDVIIGAYAINKAYLYQQSRTSH